MINTMPDDQKKAVRWYIDCSDDDFLYEGNCLVHIAMRKKDIPHEFRIRDGAHNWTYRRASFAKSSGVCNNEFPPVLTEVRLKIFNRTGQRGLYNVPEDQHSLISLNVLSCGLAFAAKKVLKRHHAE